MMQRKFSKRTLMEIEGQMSFLLIHDFVMKQNGIMIKLHRFATCLFVVVVFLFRCITKSESCVWHETYRKIVEHVQHFMQIEYNSDLMVPSIGCNLHKCRGDDVL